MTLFDRNFISAQHARHSPISPEHRFLFDHIEDDARARLDFLKTPPKRAAIQGRRPSRDLDAMFEFVGRYKLDPDTESLQFWNDDGKPYDLVLTLLSLHAANFVPEALKNMKARLSDDGVFLASVFGGKTLLTLRQSLAAAEMEIYGEAGPRVYPFAEAVAWAGQMQNAGFALPVADAEMVTVHYRSLNALLKDLRMMGEANGMTQRPRRPLFPHVIARAEEIYKTLAPTPDGLLPAEFEIVWMMGFAK